MTEIRPALILDFTSMVLSGGYRRTFEILRLGKSEGINYVVVTDSQSCKNASKIFSEYLKVLLNYKTYLTSYKEKHTEIPGLRQLFAVRDIFLLALFVSRVARMENADLIVGFERTKKLLVCFLASKLSNKPWTAIFQPTTDLLQPSTATESINIFNVLKFVSSKTSTKNLSLYFQIGIAIGLLFQLKLAERALMLPVSRSVVEEVQSLDPKIKFHVIEPGNGVRQEEFTQAHARTQKYDAIFFGRLIPEKGLFELPAIWRRVIKRLPKATLAVAGIIEDQIYVNHFLDIISQNQFSPNIIFLGELDEASLRRSLRSSKLTLNPSLVDSFSLVTLESLASGTPVVAYNIPAIAWNFGKCEAVLRCKIKDHNEMADKTLLILKNENLRANLSKKAKEYSFSYDWRDVVRAEKKAYFKVIEHSRL